MPSSTVRCRPARRERRRGKMKAHRLIVAAAVSMYLIVTGMEARADKKPPITQYAQPVSDTSDAVGVAPAVADKVTADRLVNARKEPNNWLTYYGAYDGQRFSALDQINSSTVKSLRPAWQF